MVDPSAPVLEIVATSGACARVATAAGAERLEVCEALELGGITPNPEIVQAVLEHRPALGVHALLRSRPGDFHYTPEELSLMERQATRLALAGVDGLVLGALTPQGQLDLETIRRLADAGLSVNPTLEITVHRAIDACNSQVSAVTQLLELPITRVLTSGGRNAAGEGMETIARMVRAADNRMQIMSGGGLRLVDLPDARKAGVAAVHASAKEEFADTIRVSEDQVQRLRNALDDQSQ